MPNLDEERFQKVLEANQRMTMEINALQEQLRLMESMN